MKDWSAETDTERLRYEIEGAIRASRSAKSIEPMLERLLQLASPGSDNELFARRHLSEMLLSERPWQAALHLRVIARYEANDDVVHALTGLCHALMGNFRTAIRAYRRALAIEPSNPWYHHNVGHLMDVALSRPAEALHHLRLAHRYEPEEHEIAASLAHCLGQLERWQEAEELATRAASLAPRNKDHRLLLEWLRSRQQDAPKERGNKRGKAAKSAAEQRRSETILERGVLRQLDRSMREAGFSSAQRKSAKALWIDFHRMTSVRTSKPEVIAAAVEYACASIWGLSSSSRASIAKRYGVGRAALSRHYSRIRDTLDLQPADPRYPLRSSKGR